MQTNLTLQHILPYLSEGLKFEIYKHVDTVPTWEVDTLEIACSEYLTFTNNADFYLEDPQDNETQVKPILKPLSDYKAEYMCNRFSTEYANDIYELANGIIGIDNVRFGAVELMASAKIDFQNLIAQGLAVDENTLTEKVY